MLSCTNPSIWTLSHCLRKVQETMIYSVCFTTFLECYMPHISEQAKHIYLLRTSQMVSIACLWAMGGQNMYLYIYIYGRTHYNDGIMSVMASQITSHPVVYSTVYSGADQRKHHIVSLAFVRGIHWWPVNSPHKGPVTRKMFPFVDSIIIYSILN